MPDPDRHLAPKPCRVGVNVRRIGDASPKHSSVLGGPKWGLPPNAGTVTQCGTLMQYPASRHVYP